MDEIWSKILEQVLLAALPILAAAVVGWILQSIREGWARLDDRKREMIAEAVKVAVYAAEQAGAAGLIEGKKEYALEIAEKWLASKGINLNIDLLDAAIEAAVLEEFNRFKFDFADEGE